nr:unnamed protein product [Digitaria exilis]
MELGTSNCGMPETNAAGKLDMFRSGSGQWDVRHVGIWSSTTKDGEVQEMPTRWNVYNVVVVPVGDRTLCWAELSCGIIFCDVLEDSPLLQYIPLPAVPCFGNPPSHRNVRATADGTLKFVNIFPRCCCGGAGVSSCQHSKSAYTIQTWTLRMDDMEWVMDAMVDATELWALESYNGLPRVLLDYPIMSIEEPHVICFMLCEGHHVKHGGGDRTLWQVMVDTRSKTIQSVSRHPRVEWFHGDDLMIPSSVSYYFNCHPMPKSEGQISHLMDIEKQKDDDSGNSMMRSSYKSSVEPFVQLSEILAALQEIPNYGLCRDDTLKAYSILSHDDGQQFRSLLGLPSTLRKDWFLMEIKKAGDADR